MRDHFDLDSKLIYLNSGTHSICPRSVLDAVQKHQREFEKNPTLRLAQTWGELWEIQSALAQFFGADPHDLILRANVTACLNFFLLGIPLPGKSEILTTDLEYGAIVNICRFRAERDNLSIRSVRLAMDSPSGLLDGIVSSLRPNTRLLLISHVMTANGLVVPLEELARETRKRGVLLVVDGAHGPGAVPLDFRKLADVDFYGGNLHKWMLGPKGTSFGWVSPRHRESLRMQQAGWTSYEVPLSFQKFGEGDPITARWLMAACHDWAPFLAIKELLEFWTHHGQENIRTHHQAILKKARDAFATLGWPLLSPEHPALSGPLLSYELPEALARVGYDLMFQLEKRYGLQIATPPVQGRFVARISPAIYNTEEELGRAVAILKDAEKSYS